MKKMRKEGTLPIWGGIECTINRVENNFFDQLQCNGYYSGPAQLNEIIRLGLKTIRFPVLWEKHQPSLEHDIDWSWCESQLALLQSNDVEPIVGLLHHGSGPAFTDLLNNDFPEQFANYAAKVAAKFPWITFYTPVNEPLTTARFSGLYGLWYPHKNNDVSFIRMLLNELKGVVLAMKEIRKINPEAKLVQTEDLGKTYSTPMLKYQAGFENQRRWLTYDILCGKFSTSHPLWNYFMRLGIGPECMQFFTDNPCPPDIIGVNYYVTSERYLDENIENFPAHTIGGNGIHRYADVEAVRVKLNEPHGLTVLLTEIWERYQLPVAITEVHLHCAREEQLRWFKEVYDTANKLRNEGVDICGVTAWALMGSFGWSKLLTSFPGEYETGVFDTSAGTIRPTALAKLITRINNNEDTGLEGLTTIPGWWKCSSRYFIKSRQKDKWSHNASVKPIIITGKGTLASAFAKICADRRLPYLLAGPEQVDICNSDRLERMIEHYQPWAIINAASFSDIDGAGEEKDAFYRENYPGAQKLAIICERTKVKLLNFSTDQVFDGNTNRPYIESDTAAPLNSYGHSKLLAESFLSNVNSSSLIIRTGPVFGPVDELSFTNRMISALSSGKTFTAADDITISLTYVPHLVHASLDLLVDDASGTWHLANKGSVTWFQFAGMVAQAAGLDVEQVIPCSNEKYKAARPAFSSLTSEKYSLMPLLETALEHYIQQLVTELSINQKTNSYENI